MRKILTALFVVLVSLSANASLFYPDYFIYVNADVNGQDLNVNNFWAKEAWFDEIWVTRLNAIDVNMVDYNVAGDANISGNLLVGGDSNFVSIGVSSGSYLNDVTILNGADINFFGGANVDQQLDLSSIDPATSYYPIVKLSSDTIGLVGSLNWPLGWNKHTSGALRLVLGDASAGTSVINSGITTETYRRWYLGADGKMNWGSGSGSADTTLYRAAANHLKTDDKFEALELVGGKLTVDNLTIDGSTISTIADMDITPGGNLTVNTGSSGASFTHGDTFSVSVNNEEDITIQTSGVGSTKIGDGGTSNYIEIDSDGNLVQFGSGTSASFNNTTNYNADSVLMQDLNVLGNANIDGNYGAYGELWASYQAQAITLPSPNFYHIVNDWNAGDFYNTTLEPDLNRITINQDGMYLINCSLSFSGSLLLPYGI